MNSVRIAGVGETDYSRRSGRSFQQLGTEASRAALADALLGSKAIDGVISLGGSLHTEDLIAGLRLRDDVWDATPPPGGNSAVSALGLAWAAIQSGAASTVLICLARNGSSEARIGSRVRALPGQQFRDQLELPHGWSLPAQWYSMICRRHMYEFGTTKRHLAEVALTMRAHAQLNARAMMHGRPMTFADYESAPMVADPYQVYDCCLETDGGVAVIVTARTPPAEAGTWPALLGFASARPESADDLTNRDDWFRIGLSLAARRAYNAAGLGPQDVDVALVYDCFTFEVLHQLEEAGWCPRGEAGPFVMSGAIRLGGRLPVNPHGGLLSEGHLGGLNHVVEAVRQLRGGCGDRQVVNAKVAAVTGWGDWGDGSLGLLGL